jgi:heparinase II/III-like protein
VNTMPSLHPVYCVIAREHRSLDVADAVASGRFTIQGVTLDLGVEPDWMGAPLPADREWRLEWSKFYYGLDLAWAYRRTGDVKYLEAWERLTGSWIASVPAGFDSTDVIGRRIQNWIYAWARFDAAPGRGVSAGVKARLIDSLGAQVSYLRTHLTAERNHRTLELYALFIACLALPALDADGSLLRFTMTELSRNLHDDILADGVHRERSTHYHLLVLRTFLGVMENARRFGIQLPDPDRDRVARACDFAAHCHRPDGSIPALSDSDTGRYAALLALAARLFRRRDWLYVATQGRRGAPPASGAASFPAGGYFIQRSGWGTARTKYEDERYLIFDCGALGDGGHGHYDVLNIEIAAGGRPLLVDPGRFTYHADNAAAWRHWFKGTAAHNTVTVDGRDQVAYRPGRPRGPLPRAAFGGRREFDGLDVIWGDVVSPCYDAVHQRRILFVAGEYWIVEDRLTAASHHRYDLRFHLAPEAAGRAVVYGGAHPAAWSPGLGLVFGSSHEISIDEGWVSPAYGIKRPAPVVVVTERHARDVRFITLLVPLRDRTPLPRMRIRTADRAPLTVVEVEGLGHSARDVVSWNDQGAAAFSRETFVPREMTA